MKYQKRIHWDQHRPEFLKLGFIFALAITFMAFNYTSNAPIYVPFELEEEPPDYEVIPPITVQKKKRVLPPPPPPKKINVDEIEPTTEPVIEFKKEIVIEHKEKVIVDEFANDPVPDDPPMVDIIETIKPVDEPPVVVAERMPVYGDCDLNLDEEERRKCTTKNLLEHAYDNVDYPDLARSYGLEGTVVVRFIVTKSGDVQDVKILKDIGMGCGDEVKKAIQKLDKFLPGKQNGRPVSVIYTVPVNFTLIK